MITYIQDIHTIAENTTYGFYVLLGILLIQMLKLGLNLKTRYKQPNTQASKASDSNLRGFRVTDLSDAPPYT
jgi:hypothetical protein